MIPFLFLHAATAGLPPADPSLSPLSAALRHGLALSPGKRASWGARRPSAPGPDRLEVVIEAGPGFRVEDLPGGVELEARAEGLVQVRCPWTALPALARLPGVRRVREPRVARPRDVVTEGLDDIFYNDWHDQGITGKGVDVAIVDVGFRGWEDLVGTELPRSTQAELQAGGEKDDHGTAVAEIVHDIAPGARLNLYSFATDVEYLQLLDTIEGLGTVEVVNASIGFDNYWPADGSSPFSRKVDELADAGIAYVAAAGNEAYNYAVGELTDADGDGWVEIGGLDHVTVYTWDGGVDVSLRWSDPIDSSGNDLDLVVTDMDGDELCRSQEVQAGDGYPYEAAWCDAPGEQAQVWIQDAGADLQGLTGYVYSFYGVDESEAALAGTLTLPADARGAIAVGAYYLANQELAWYSSEGPTDDGRVKPDLVAPTGVSTATLGPRAAEGTSFSAPHVAGVAALLLDADGGMSAWDVRDYLRSTARDLGPPGADDLYGWGAVQTRDPPEGCGCTASSPAAGAAGLLLALAALGRRRRR